MAESTITIARRFCGPPNSANGGYAAGRLAHFIDGDTEVTLCRPPPLDSPLDVVAAANGSVELYNADGQVVAWARPADVGAVRVTPPGVREAAEAAARSFGADVHGLPTCFVCGPLRDHGDGLRIHVGPVDPQDSDWNGVLAAPFVPDASLGDEQGRVRTEFLWAALDCPTAYACGNGDGLQPILLGRQAVSIGRRPAVGEACVVAARYRGRERRKNFAEAILADAAGKVLASGRATWIEVSASVQKGAG